MEEIFDKITRLDQGELLELFSNEKDDIKRNLIKSVLEYTIQTKQQEVINGEFVK